MVEWWERWIALNGNDDMEDGILDDGNIVH